MLAMILKRSRGWRAFAVLVLILVLPSEFGGLFKHPKAFDALRYGVDTLAAVGLTGYAFARPMGPQAFWRFFAPVFILFSTVVFMSGLPRILMILQAASYAPMFLAALGSMLAMMFSLIWFISVGLMRHVGWIADRACKSVDLAKTFN
ncbi:MULTISPECIES: hypothetical protein [unclassified Novosphingobium]|uniref:hypothetical protein n=1 Tax=unclassified Novosphingobium TaxID=2644732 RepID=UPI00135C96AB|nr:MULTISPECIES: hypothetical protein [unclassified Novosphingobium]